MAKADLMKLDLYGILGVSPDSTEKEIVKAYRKKALKCHPDKNPDNPKAVELFHELSKALEVLTDAAAKAAYDKILKSKKAAEFRNRQLDSKRKKFKDDLDAREAAAEAREVSEKDAASDLEAEIKRLRKEGSTLLQEEQERLKEELKQEVKSKWEQPEEEPEDAAPGARLKVKWKAQKNDENNGGYTYDYLHKAFDKYGEVTALVISSKKKGAAIVEFSTGHGALLAVQNEIGIPSNPLNLTWLSGQPSSSDPSHSNFTASSSTNFQDSGPQVFQKSLSMTSKERDYEDIVLMRMRQAQERKRLTEEMQKEDG